MVLFFKSYLRCKEYLLGYFDEKYRQEGLVCFVLLWILCASMS